MPHDIHDNPTFTTPIRSIKAGEQATQANFDLAPQGLANRTAWLYANLCNPNSGSGVDIPIVPFVTSGSVWGWNGAYPIQDTTGSTFCMMGSDIKCIPYGARVMSFTASVIPRSSHVSLPAQVPLLQVVEYSFFPGTAISLQTEVASISDTSPNVSGYNAPHHISGTCDFYFDRTKRYEFVFYGERGANSLNGLALTGLRVGFLPPTGSY